MYQGLNVFYREPFEKRKFRLEEKENNVTHSLLVAIQQNPRLMRVVINKSLDGKASLGTGFETYFQSEGTQGKVRLRKNRVLLFIRSKSNLCEDKSEELQEKRSRPDALLVDENTAIVIEAKVNAAKNDAQLERYCQEFGLQATVETTWEDLYEAIGEFDDKAQNPYVLGEFKKYLEAIGLSGFQGIPFDKKTPYEKEYASSVLKQLLAELESSRFFEREGLHLYNRGQSGHIWDAVLLKKYAQRKPFEVPHNSVYLWENKYSIDLVFRKSETKK